MLRRPCLAPASLPHRKLARADYKAAQAKASDTALTVCFEGGGPMRCTACCVIRYSSDGNLPDVRRSASAPVRARVVGAAER